jgi:hypothetical protein
MIRGGDSAGRTYFATYRKKFVTPLPANRKNGALRGTFFAVRNLLVGSCPELRAYREKMCVAYWPGGRVER